MTLLLGVKVLCDRGPRRPRTGGLRREEVHPREIKRRLAPGTVTPTAQREALHHTVEGSRAA